MHADGGLHELKQTKRPAANPSHRKLLLAREFPHSLGRGCVETPISGFLEE
jgi:hypothetical protein